jgi:hypothetical protein
LRQERELLLSLPVARPVRADLLAVAMTVGTRFFARELREAIFREEMVMLKEASGERVRRFVMPGQRIKGS